jgi:hypothetical protein
MHQTSSPPSYAAFFHSMPRLARLDKTSLDAGMKTRLVAAF